MEKHTTEGVIINAIPFRNYDCILTVFTPHEGLLKFFCRGAYSKKNNSGSGTTTPLSIVEIVYTKGRGDLYICAEIVVINHNLALRNNLATLNAACDMLQAISATQQPGKSAPELYQLLMMYLNKLPSLPLTSNPQTITGSFRLKLLRYEGVLSLLSHCCVCSELLHDTWLHESEAYCASHTSPGALFLSKEERGLVELLAFGRSFSTLAAVCLPDPLSQKISRLFNESFAA